MCRPASKPYCPGEGESVLRILLPGPLNLEVTLECGQAFRWEKVQGSRGIAYKGVVGAYSVMLSLCDVSGTCGEKDAGREFPCLLVSFDPVVVKGTTREMLADAVFRYLSLDDDLDTIETTLIEKDQIMRKALEFSRGLRLLRQDPWECLASYIISVHNNIPAIRRVISYLSKQLGEPTGLREYSFPAPRAILSNPAVLDLARCGFRKEYLLDAARKVDGGEVDLSALGEMPVEKAASELMKIKGVGPKVADCVLLFAYHRLEVFPVDVWILRAMSRFYFGGRQISTKTAREEGIRRFGKFAGYAQEHLYHYVRNSFGL
ncbi:MAG: DNA-3-methyladenine glycosylase 2 family protein [Candidatus Fermentithermobacillus carboniphilus]|uniref:DNA-(apurinic or apyrimidinic site) lyase n=1 Tax=Candidatus Fermentithermobacillus carboniphilus TaxID=3085328 RepID=A0AAT9LCW5_9FIRM|nr:MAG: DNA-3-methyladenine glycosylase 2 family protein [Candidatus Fermentithermobacillus carboniphilus]